MSLADDILTILFSYPAGYRRMRELILRPDKSNVRRRTEIKQETLYLTLARLKRNGFVTKRDGDWFITPRGKEHFSKKREASFPHHSSRRKRNKASARKNMILAFDIPERFHRKRDWLRIELVLLGFSPIQKSVWFGPAPLPREFIAALNEMDILGYLKFFKTEEWEIA